MKTPQYRRIDIDIHGCPWYHAKMASVTKTGKREKIAVWLENRQIAMMRKIQENEDVPIAAQIRRAVAEYLERRNK